ncbi:hypothetical protein B4N84_10440 [Flavobacterium sp. IR1]|nr:hypothetical protein B4N84_10440 [Flavobacterium sp. IR1]
MRYKPMNYLKTKLLLLICLISLFSCKKEIKTVTKKSKPNTDTIAVAEPKKEKVILTEIESNFLKKLIEDETNGHEYREKQINESPYYVSIAEEDPYTVYFSIVAKADFNNDGIIDYIVNRSSEGMLGGNVHTNQQYMYCIMKDEINEKETHSILGYAPFSYNIIDEAKFMDNKLKVDITQNFRTYMSEDIKSTSLSFIYKNGNVYEESYLSDCELAKLKSKTIFNNIPEVEKRIRSIDMHNYTETIEEVYKKNDTIITANLEGCDNLTLSFDTNYNVEADKMDDTEFRKVTALQLLDFLAQHTQFSAEINVIISYYKKHKINDEFIEDVPGFGFRILIQKNNENKKQLRFLIDLKKIVNPKQDENWEIATRARG